MVSIPIDSAQVVDPLQMFAVGPIDVSDRTSIENQRKFLDALDLLIECVDPSELVLRMNKDCVASLFYSLKNLVWLSKSTPDEPMSYKGVPILVEDILNDFKYLGLNNTTEIYATKKNINDYRHFEEFTHSAKLIGIKAVKD